MKPPLSSPPPAGGRFDGGRLPAGHGEKCPAEIPNLIPLAQPASSLRRIPERVTLKFRKKIPALCKFCSPRGVESRTFTPVNTHFSQRKATRRDQSRPVAE